MKAILMKGLPASGKSTRAEKQEWYIVISKDKIRKSYPNLSEKDVHKFQIKLITDAKTDIIIDNTHMNKSTLQSTIDLCKSLWYETEVKDMYFWEWDFADIDYLYECIKRNKERENSVPESVIHEMYLKNYNMKLNYYIFDIDGTIAKMSPKRKKALEDKDYGLFYSDLVLEDEPIRQTIRVLNFLEDDRNSNIILMSWRSNECCQHTVERLNKYKIPYARLLMRQSWDHRQDAYIKSELYDKCLSQQEGKCLWVFDDREQVMSMWRDKWLFVFDVSQGNRDF